MAAIVLAVLITIDADDHVEHLRLPNTVAAAIVAAERARRDAEPAPERRAGLRPVPQHPGEALSALSETGDAS